MIAYQKLEAELNNFESQEENLTKALLAIQMSEPMTEKEISMIQEADQLKQAADKRIAIHDEKKPEQSEDEPLIEDE